MACQALLSSSTYVRYSDASPCASHSSMSSIAVVSSSAVKRCVASRIRRTGSRSLPPSLRTNSVGDGMRELLPALGRERLMQLIRMLSVVPLHPARLLMRRVVVHSIRHEVALVQLVKEYETTLVLVDV